MSSNRLWILGGSDPEMEMTEARLREAEENVVYAMAAGKRVHAGNAYKADAMRVSESEDRAGDVTVYLVECGVPLMGLQHDDEYQGLVVVIDHHRPGDPGYGRPPAEFLAASSLGQVISELARLGRLPDDWPVAGEETFSGDGSIRFWEGSWIVDAEAGGAPCRIPQGIVMAAAADHCLGAAYRGECPGVDPDELMAWRVSSRATFQGRPEADILADVARAREALWAAPLLDLDEGSGCGCPMGEGRSAGAECPDCGTPRLRPTQARDMRGHHVPELPEASAREGLCFVGDGLPDPDGRIKIVCQSGSPEQIRAFIETWAPAQGLVGIYGDPARGFAGAYMP